MQNARYNSKRLKQWTEYKIYRNKTKQIIRAAKGKFFTESESVSNSKDKNTFGQIYVQLLETLSASSKHLPKELTIDNKHLTKAED